MCCTACISSMANSSGPATVTPISRAVPTPGERGTLGLLKKGLSAFHQRNGQNDAGASDATSAVADGRFRVGLRHGSKAGFFNSPALPQFPV
jgi:hypothetical protein